MPGTSRPRVLLSIDPPVFEELIAGLLNRTELDDVVLVRDVVTPDSFDAALTSRPLPLGVNAGVLIELPDDLGHAGVGTVTTRGMSDAVEIGKLDDLLGLLDAYCPVVSGRRCELLADHLGIKEAF